MSMIPVLFTLVMTAAVTFAQESKYIAPETHMLCSATFSKLVA